MSHHGVSLRVGLDECRFRTRRSDLGGNCILERFRTLGCLCRQTFEKDGVLSKHAHGVTRYQSL